MSIYVSNFNSDSVSVFERHACGNTAPVRQIVGGRTRLRAPIGMAVDAGRNLYVANRGGTGVTVYAPDAEGDVAPLRVLNAVGLQAAEALAIGPSGDVYVSSWPNGVGTRCTSIFHFGADAERSDYAISGSNTGLSYPIGLATDRSARSRVRPPASTGRSVCWSLTDRQKLQATRQVRAC